MPARRENCIFSNVHLRESFSGVVGASRNAKMSVTIAATTATFSAGELIVEDSGGRHYRLTSFNKTINLAISGVGGMDTGSAPTAGFVAIYAIYNPTTDTSGLVAVSVPVGTVAPETCAGTMPTGFTASALVSVWRVASGLLIPGVQHGRNIASTDYAVLSTTTQQTTPSLLSVPSVIPLNAVKIYGWGGIETNGTGNAALILSTTGTAPLISRKVIQQAGGVTINAPYSLTVSNSLFYYTLTSTAAVTSASIIINEYEF